MCMGKYAHMLPVTQVHVQIQTHKAHARSSIHRLNTYIHYKPADSNGTAANSQLCATSTVSDDKSKFSIVFSNSVKPGPAE